MKNKRPIEPTADGDKNDEGVNRGLLCDFRNLKVTVFGAFEIQNEKIKAFNYLLNFVWLF